MARTADKEKLRQFYIFQRLSLEVAAKRLNVPFSTAARWKKEALDAGDDWEQWREANMLSGGTIEDTARGILLGLVVQYQATVKLLEDDLKMPKEKQLGVIGRTEVLASLLDGMSKMRSSIGKLLPQADSMGIAMRVLRALGDHISANHKEHGEAFVAILDSFAPELSKALEAAA
jgi:Protein of unknown function (DUF1804)